MVGSNIQEIMDFRNILEKNYLQFWEDVKIKFVKKDVRDGVDMIKEVIGTKYYSRTCS